MGHHLCPNILRCKCARYDCALLVGRVKVECHKDVEFGCGKVLRSWGLGATSAFRKLRGTRQAEIELVKRLNVASDHQASYRRSQFP